MSKKGITLIVVGALVLALLVALGMLEVKGRFEKLEELYSRKEKILNADSLRSAIESAIVDSINNKLSARDKLIQDLRNDLNKTRKQNAELEKKFDNIRVNMPEF